MRQRGWPWGTVILVWGRVPRSESTDSPGTTAPSLWATEACAQSLSQAAGRGGRGKGGRGRGPQEGSGERVERWGGNARTHWTPSSTSSEAPWVGLSACPMGDKQRPLNWALTLAEPPGQTRLVFVTSSLLLCFASSTSPPEEERGSGQVRPAPCIRNRPRAPRLGSPCGRRAPPA